MCGFVKYFNLVGDKTYKCLRKGCVVWLPDQEATAAEMAQYKCGRKRVDLTVVWRVF